jgi:hypothetical protein
MARFFRQLKRDHATPRPSSRGVQLAGPTQVAKLADNRRGPVGMPTTFARDDRICLSVMSFPPLENARMRQGPHHIFGDGSEDQGCGGWAGRYAMTSH